MWVLGIISEEERGRVVLETIDARDIDSIIPIIQKRVAPGTIIKTDGLPTYDCVQYLPEGVPRHLRYKHVVVNHSHHLVDPWTGVNINLVEGNWFHFKASIPKSGVHSRKTVYASYLSEYAYRRLVRYQYPDADPFLVFLRLWGELVATKGDW